MGGGWNGRELVLVGGEIKKIGGLTGRTVGVVASAAVLLFVVVGVFAFVVFGGGSVSSPDGSFVSPFGAGSNERESSSGSSGSSSGNSGLGGSGESGSVSGGLVAVPFGGSFFGETGAGFPFSVTETPFFSSGDDEGGVTDLGGGAAVLVGEGGEPAVTTQLLLGKPQVHAGDEVSLFVGVNGRNVEGGDQLIVDILVPDGVSLGNKERGSLWGCTDDDVMLSGVLRCETQAGSFPKVFEVPIVVDEDTRGLVGFASVSWVGDIEPELLMWNESRFGNNKDFVMLSVLSPLNYDGVFVSQFGDRPVSVVKVDAAPGNKIVWGKTDKRTKAYPVNRSHSDVLSFSGSSIEETGFLVSQESVPVDGVSVSSEPSDEFCDFFEVVQGEQTAAQVGGLTFKNLNAAATDGPCGNDSTVTISGSDVSFGDVTVENFAGVATPTSLQISTQLANNNISVDIKDAFPSEAQTVISADLSFFVGGTNVEMFGELDYSNQEEFTITINGNVEGWEPLKGVVLKKGGVTGTYKQNATGIAVDIDVVLNGNWKPNQNVTVTNLEAKFDYVNETVVVDLKGAVADKIVVGDFSVKIPAVLEGQIVSSGKIMLEATVGSFTIADVVTVNETQVVFVYHPGTPGGANETVGFSGKASFAGELANFFDVEAAASLTVDNEGYVITADMISGPSGGADTFGDLTFVYAGSINPEAVRNFTLPAHSGGNVPSVSVPVVSGTPVAVVPFGVPKNLANIKGFELLDNVGEGVAVVSLNPQTPGFSVYYEPPPNTYLFGSAKSTPALKFDDIFVSVQIGPTETFSVGGEVTLSLEDGTELIFVAELDVVISETGWEVDGKLTLRDDQGWRNPLGIKGLTLEELSIGVGISDILPSLQFEGAAQFPPELTEPLGIQSDAVISFGAEIALSDPCFEFSITPPSQHPNRNTIVLADGVLTAKTASIHVAPQGCTLGSTTYTPGYHLEFNGAVKNVETQFSSTFSLQPFVFSAQGHLGEFTIGDVKFPDTKANINISPQEVNFFLDVGVLVGDNVLVGEGTVLLDSNGGFNLDGTGTIRTGENTFDVTIKATNCADNTCSQLGDVTFDASGEIKTQGFTFTASIQADSQGNFDAKLSIPKTKYGFSHKTSTVNVKGTLEYELFLEISNTQTGEVSVSISVGSLNPCQVKAVFWWDCSTSGTTTVQGKIGAGEITATIKWSGKIPKDVGKTHTFSATATIKT